ncbi:hypothetical protein D9M68_923980 [compost metagenome]
MLALTRKPICCLNTTSNSESTSMRWDTALPAEKLRLPSLLFHELASLELALSTRCA